MAKKQNFLPDSIRGAACGVAFRGLGVALIFLGAWLCFALIFHNPYLDGFAAASSFGRQSLIGNIVGFILYGIGFIPALFIFLFMARSGIAMMLKWDEGSPEYNILRAFITTIIGSFGFGAVMPSKAWGGLVGAIVAHDIGLFANGWVFVFGIILIAVFFIDGRNYFTYQMARLENAVDRITQGHTRFGRYFAFVPIRNLLRPKMKK